MEDWSCCKWIDIKHPYRRHHYVLQNVLMLQVIQVTLYMMDNSSPFMGDPAPTVDRHTTTAIRVRRILQVVTLSFRSLYTKTGPSFAELNVDLSVSMTHLQWILLSANAKQCGLYTSVRSSFTTACCALRPAALSLEIILSFCPGQPVAAVRPLAL